ncbi:hypothetical protein OSTOST_15751, partial [Ostertagia ostertagi]
QEGDTPSFSELSLLNHSYEDDPLRGFYTIWYSNTTRVAKSKLSSSEKVFEYISSIWGSPEVDRSLCKPPRGGVCGRIDDPSLLSAKGRDTLQRWSRVVSHYDVGNESGEDEDPVEMWNRAVETSMLNASAASSGTPNKILNSARKRKHDSESGTDDITESPLAASTAVRPKPKVSRRKTAPDSAEDSPVATMDHRSPDESPVAMKIPQLEPYERKPLRAESLKGKEGLSERKLLVTPSARASPESNRRSPRIQVMSAVENTPSGRGATTKAKKNSDCSMVSSGRELVNSFSDEKCDENSCKGTASPNVSTLVGASSESRSKKSPLPTNISEAQPPAHVSSGDIKTPLARRSASSSLRRRALLNSAIRSTESAEKSSSTPIGIAGGAESRTSEEVAETPKTGRAADKNAAVPASPSRRESPKKQTPSKISTPSKRSSPAPASSKSRETPKTNSARKKKR